MCEEKENEGSRERIIERVLDREERKERPTKEEREKKGRREN